MIIAGKLSGKTTNKRENIEKIVIVTQLESDR